jgi:hypothetical protein
MHGRSSCISDMVCIISMAHALGMATSRLPPNISQAARHNAGRMRLPPASREYRMDLVTVSGYATGQAASSASFTWPAFFFMYSMNFSEATSPNAPNEMPTLAVQGIQINERTFRMLLGFKLHGHYCTQSITHQWKWQNLGPPPHFVSPANKMLNHRIRAQMASHLL